MKIKYNKNKPEYDKTNRKKEPKKKNTKHIQTLRCTFTNAETHIPTHKKPLKQN